MKFPNKIGPNQARSVTPRQICFCFSSSEMRNVKSSCEVAASNRWYWKPWSSMAPWLSNYPGRAPRITAYLMLLLQIVVLWTLQSFQYIWKLILNSAQDFDRGVHLNLFQHVCQCIFFIDDDDDELPRTSIFYLATDQWSNTFWASSGLWCWPLTCTPIYSVLSSLPAHKHRQHCRLSICGHFGWVWQILRQTTVFSVSASRENWAKIKKRIPNGELSQDCEKESKWRGRKAGMG